MKSLYKNMWEVESQVHHKCLEYDFLLCLEHDGGTSVHKYFTAQTNAQNIFVPIAAEVSEHINENS